MFTEIIVNTINEYNMICRGDKVFVALSGGADSVCLLCILNDIKEKLEFTLEAVHINHLIRGEESDRDELFCISLCEKLNIPIHVYKIDIPALAKERKKSTEETARDERYKKFSEIADENCKIATAHTLSDNGETMIFNIARGTGIKGLCGIPPKRDNIIRPLSGITREQVEEYLTGISQSYKTDSTNLCDDYNRNKIRHNVIPVLKEINNGFYKSLSKNLSVIREENNFLEELTNEAFSTHFDNNKLINISEIPAVIRKRMISRYLSENNLPVSFENINEINRLSETDGKFNIKKGCYITSKNNCIFIEKEKITLPYREISLKEGENRIFENSLFFAEYTKKGSNIIDTDKICGKILLHSRRTGDKIKLSGRNFTSSVKKLLNENVPENNRPYIHFLSDDKGLIFIEEFGVADRVKADENTKSFLSVTIKRKEG